LLPGRKKLRKPNKIPRIEIQNTSGQTSASLIGAAGNSFTVGLLKYRQTMATSKVYGFVNSICLKSRDTLRTAIPRCDKYALTKT